MTPSEKVLIIKEKYIQIYKMYERIILPMVKFFMVLLVLMNINHTIGIMQFLANPIVIFIVAIIAAFLSPGLIMILFMGIITAHIANFNIILGATVFGIFSLVYILFIRLYPKESLLILFTAIAFQLKMEYAVLLIVPLFGGAASLIAIVLGVIFYFTNMFIIAIVQGNNMTAQIQDVFINIINSFTQNILTNKEMLATISIFVIVFIIVYVIRNLSIDYASYVAIVVGAIINLLAFGIAILFLELNMNVLILILMTILSSILGIIVTFLSKALDYSRAEVVQFEDEDNYYYVKVVPKVCISTNNKKIKQVYTTTNQEKSLDFMHRNYME